MLDPLLVDVEEALPLVVLASPEPVDAPLLGDMLLGDMLPLEDEPLDDAPLGEAVSGEVLLGEVPVVASVGVLPDVLDPVLDAG